MTDEEYLARLGLLRPQSGKRKPQEPVPAGSSVLDVPVGGTRRIPDTVLRRPAQPEDTITGLPEPSMAQRHAESLAGYLTPKVGGPRARAIAQTALGGDESALPFGIGLQEFVPFSPYVAEEAGRMVRSGVETGSPLEIGLGLGLGALQASPAAKPIARGAKAVGKRVREAADPEAIRQYVRQTQGLTGMPGTAVIKPKGGNWLEGSVERETESLKPMTNWQIDNDINSSKAKIASMENAGNAGYSLDLEKRTLKNLEDERKLNNWIDKKLNKYIRNEMGTPEDPVRKLAEQGILHFEPLQSRVIEANAELRRAATRGQKLAQSELAKKWEDIGDSSIEAWRAGSVDNWGGAKIKEENPWIDKLPPEDKVFSMSPDVVSNNAGFDHLIDELHNATHPNSDLPAHLRWKPEDLDKVTMAQAVERVSKINDWRAAQMEAAKKAAREGIPVHKQYEGGYQWMAAPDTAKDPKSLKYIQDVGCESGWCTQGESLAKQYGGGGNQLYVLHDPNGKSVVQISVKPGRPWNQRSGIFYDHPELEAPWATFSKEVNAAAREKGVDRDPNYIVGFPDWLAKNQPEIFAKYKSVFQESPAEIVEIKGRQNRPPKEEHLPMVQDFVRSGNWSRVGDFKNTGLDFPATGPQGIFDADQIKTLEANGIKVPNYLTRDEAKSLQDQLYRIETGKNPETGMAAGGLVQNTDTLRDKLIAAGMDPEQAMTQALRMADQVEMAEGGGVKAAQDWRRKLVGGGIRGIVTRGLLGMDPPEDMTPRERDIYENMVRLSAPAQGLGVGKAIFIGAKAKTWNKSAADRFVEMEKAGVSPEKMWRETGTFRGADGKLRQEISDVGAIHRNPAQLQELGKAKKEEAKELQLRMVTPIGQKDLFPKALTEAKKPVREQVKKLKDEADELMRHSDVRGQSARFVLEHPDLYKAYPELADIPVMQGVSGSGRGSLIGAGPDLQMSITQQGLRHDPKSTALHEMQHAVQALEEMAPGGSPAMAFQNPKAFEILQELRAKASTPMSFEKFVEQYGSNANNAGRYEEYLKSIPQTVAGLERQLQQTAAMEYYKRLAGEAEARATQFREKMGPTQRLQEFPYSSYDVLPEDLIVRPPKGAGMGEGMQAGGLAKAAKAALQKKHPTTFPPIAPLTKQEIRPMAQRISEQMTGEFVRPDPKLSFNPAGKARKTFEREKTLPVEVTQKIPARPATPVNYEELEGGFLVGVPGDPTIGGVAKEGALSQIHEGAAELKRLGDVEFEHPVQLFGGPQYGAFAPDDHFWASNLGPARGVQNIVTELGQDAPVYGQYIKMSPESSNFALHNLDALLSYMQPEKLSKSKLEKLNREIRKGSPKYGKFPGFQGFEDPVDVLLQAQMNSDLRKHIAETLMKPTVTQELGLRPGSDVLFGITEPSLRNVETGLSGFSIGRMKPGAELTESRHPTYTHDIPGLYLGQSKYPVPVELAFPTSTSYVRSQLKPGVQEFNMLKMVGPRERIDPQYIDQMKMYEELMKEYTGKKDGGVVKPEGADDFAKQVMQKIANQQVSA